MSHTSKQNSKKIDHNTAIPKEVWSIAENNGMNSVDKIVFLDGIEYYGVGFVDKSGFPLPIGLPTIIRGNAETGYELICGEEGLSLLEYLDKNGLLSGK